MSVARKGIGLWWVGQPCGAIRKMAVIKTTALRDVVGF
jgi:hypothetical protein